MGGAEELLYSRALEVIRVIRGWNQKELAAASGDRSEMISAWESARPAPSREVVVRLARAMGRRESFVDKVLDLLDEALPVRPGRRCGDVAEPAPGKSVEEQLDSLAKDLAEEHRIALRRNLRAGVRGGLAILEREIAEELWFGIRDLEAKTRKLVVETDSRYHRWGVAERLAHESAVAAADENKLSLDLAELALAVAGKLDPAEPWSARVQGYVHFFLANAQRVGGDLLAAERTFARGWVLWRNGATGDPGLLDEGRPFDLEASLRRAQRRLPEALSCLEEALRRSEPAGIPRLLVKKAKTVEEMGEAEDAIRILLEALPQVDPEQEPRLAWSIRFNLVVNLCALGRAEEGAGWLPELGELALELGNGLDRIRFRWLQGKVFAGRARRAEALQALGEARDEFLSREIGYDAALASLEMAVLLLEEGRTADVKEVALRLGPVFAAQGIHREALAALLVFRKAAEAEAATLNETHRVLDFLRRAQTDPALRWGSSESASEGSG